MRFVKPPLNCRKLAVAAALLVITSGCSQTTGSIPGPSHKTEPQCHRSAPPGEFDQNCDEPRLGFKNFSPPPIVTGL
ncbi:MAG: hypothetical protein E5W83_25640 [Mesorhizobium sp.]|nr:MAG: hypothetical protein E5W89_14430 [Mesorhizobium sp.]TJW41516.1 MAG: hypothetical protein E5W83_25640 [Mesorhizobium sp.]